MNEFKEFIIDSISISSIELAGISLIDLDTDQLTVIDELVTNKQVVKLVLNDVIYLLPYSDIELIKE